MIEQSEHSRYLLNTVRYAAQHGRCAWTELSDCDRVAVALALDHADWLQEFGYTLALYESGHRISPAVDEVAEILGPGRVIAVAKEITKLHESFLVGPAGDVRTRLARTSLKGEFVLLIAPADFAL